MKNILFVRKITISMQFMRKKTIKRSRKPVDRNNPEFSLFRTIKNHKSQMFNFSNLIPHEINQSLELNFESGNSKNFKIESLVIILVI